MKLKFYKETIKDSFLITLFTIIFNIIFSMISFLLISYWVIPGICIFSAPLRAYLEALNQDPAKLSAANNIFYTISAIIAMVPSCAFALRISKKRKKDFLKKTNSIISYKDGIQLHYLSYGVSDIIAYVSATVLFTLIFVISNNTFPVSLFPLVYTTFNTLGMILGLLTTVITLALSSIAGIFFAQRKWRVDHFMD